MSQDPTTGLTEPRSSASDGDLLRTVDVPEPLSLRQNFSWSFVGNVIYAGCQWGMLLVLAKLTTEESVGVFGFAMALTAPIIVFSNLQLRAVVATDVTRQHLFGDYLTLRLVSTLIALAVIVGVALLSGYPHETALVVIAIGLAKAIESISDIIYGLLQQVERLDRIAWLMIFKGCLSLAAMGLTVYLTQSLVWGIVAMSCAWAVTLVFLDWPSAIWGVGPGRARDLRPRWDARVMSHMAWRSSPLGFAAVLDSLGECVPVYLLAYYLNTREVGIYVAIAAFMRVGNLAFRPMVYAVGPRFAKYCEDREPAAFLGLVGKMLGLATLIGGIAVFLSLAFGREILTLLYAPSYAEHARLLVWLMIGITISLQARLDPAMIAMRCHRMLLTTWIIAISSLLLFACMLVPQFGIEGMGIAIALASAVRLIAMVGLGWFAFSRRLL